MAEGGLENEFRALTQDCTHTCSICLEVFREPHTLPCGHKFCALCLTGYLEKCLITEDKDIFPCPLCRSEIHVSNYIKAENEDITKLHLLSFSQTCVETESRKMSDVSCEPCKRGNENVKGTHYCSDCNESLCPGCVTHHIRNKLTCGHQVVKAEVNESLAKTRPIDSIKTKCDLHNMKKFKYICIDHKIMCCSKCVISDHRKCLDIQSIFEFSKSSQCDEMVQEIKSLFGSICKNGEKIRREQMESLSMLTENESNFGKNITELEKEMHQEISKIFCIQKTPVVKMLKNQRERSDEAVQRVDQLGSRISQTIKRFDSTKDSNDACLHVTVCLEVLKKLKTERETMKTISEVAGTLESTTPQTEIEIEPTIKHFTTSLQLASHRLTSDGCVLICHSRSERPKLRKLLSVTAKINDMSILQNGNIAIAYNSDTLTLVDSDLSQIMCITLSSQPTSVTEYSHNIVAVTLPAEKKLAVIKLYRNPHDISLFETNEPLSCLGSGSLNRHRIVVASAPKTGKLYWQSVKSSTNNDSWKVIPLHFYHVNKMCVDGSAQMVYISQYKINKITGIDLNGSVKFTFTHPQLHMPFGLFLDKTDRLYVCSYGTQQVNEITPSTREFKDVLCRSEGLKGPFAVLFDKALTRCLVYDDDKRKELKLFDM